MFLKQPKPSVKYLIWYRVHELLLVVSVEFCILYDLLSSNTVSVVTSLIIEIVLHA
jgi:hypothetical protein